MATEIEPSTPDSLLDYAQSKKKQIKPGKLKTFQSYIVGIDNIRFSHRPLSHYLQGLGLVALVTLLGWFTDPFFDATNLVMFYLLAVLIAAIRFGLGPSMMVALLSVITFNYIFIPPRFNFGFEDAEYLLSFLGLLGIGLVVSTLTARVREQVKAAQIREAQTAASYNLSHALAAAADLESIIQIIITHISRVFNHEVIILLPADDELSLYAGRSGHTLTDHERTVAGWVFQNGRPAGQRTQTLPAARMRYHPLKTAEGVVGVLGIKPLDIAEPLNPKQVQLLESFANQAAMAIERVQLAEQAHQNQLLRETEKLQTALLDSISHNLRTPLSSITGLLSSLRGSATRLDETVRADLVENAWEEADRMNRLVANLLDMTRLQAEAMHINPEPGDVQDLIGATLAELSSKLQDRLVTVTIPDDLPLVSMDFVLMIHVLINLLDNAHKYSPPGAPIEILVRLASDHVEISVGDSGPGIPDDEKKQVFEKFYRIRRADSVTGSGLGLSICKGIVEVHGGHIWAETPPHGGTIVTLSLPLNPVGAKTAEEAL